MPHIDPSIPYCWCPEYTIRSVPQRLNLVWADTPEPVGTDYFTPNIDDAELIVDDLNKRLGYENRDAWLPIAATYIEITCQGAPILLKPAEYRAPDSQDAGDALRIFLPAYTDVTEPLDLFDTRAELSTNFLAELATSLDQLLAETEDNVAFQQHHFEELRKNPELWGDHIKLRQHRAGELLRHFRTVAEHFTGMRTQIAETYQELTGEPLQFAPSFPVRPGATEELAAATAPIA